MEIRSLIPLPLPTTNGATSENTKADLPENNAARAVQPVREIQVDEQVDSPGRKVAKAEVTPNRLELLIDEATNEVFARLVDPETGKAVREIPVKELRHMKADLEKLLTLAVDEIA